MPIKDPTIYPANWKAFSREIREERSGGICENGCGARNGEIGRHDLNGKWWHEDSIESMNNGVGESLFGLDFDWRMAKVVLTVAHLNAEGGICTCEAKTGKLCADPEHVLAMCQRCHNRYDAPKRRTNAANTLKTKKDAARPLFYGYQHPELIEEKTMKEATIKERPIIFSGESVRAILDGTKTQTRRVVKMPRWLERTGGDLTNAFADKAFGVTPCLQVPCVHPDGDTSVQRLRNPWNWPEPSRLWVRETWTCHWDDDLQDFKGYLYRADGREVYHVDGPGISPWTSPIHMPRLASRITLEITDVRVERLQDISEEDAKAEGVERCGYAGLTVIPAACFLGGVFPIECYRYGFGIAWDKINGKTHPWQSNPWVWCLSFKKAE